MAEEIKKNAKRSLSLIQPTSVPTLGNYLGAMRGWKDFQDDFDTVFGIADLHSITVRQDPQSSELKLPSFMPYLWLPDSTLIRVFSLFSHMCRNIHSLLGYLIAILNLVSLAE